MCVSSPKAGFSETPRSSTCNLERKSLRAQEVLLLILELSEKLNILNILVYEPNCTRVEQNNSERQRKAQTHPKRMMK